MWDCCGLGLGGAAYVCATGHTLSHFFLALGEGPLESSHTTGEINTGSPPAPSYLAVSESWVLELNLSKA